MKWHERMQDGFLMGMMLGAVMTGLLFTFVAYWTIDATWERELVKRGLAEYNSTNGVWQWKQPENVTAQECLRQ